jgi:hypothetical protein
VAIERALDALVTYFKEVVKKDPQQWDIDPAHMREYARWSAKSAFSLDDDAADALRMTSEKFGSDYWLFSSKTTVGATRAPGNRRRAPYSSLTRRKELPSD